MKYKTDWLDWCIRAVIGFVLGPLVVFFFVAGWDSGLWTLELFLKNKGIWLASALFVAGLNARYGDRLWYNIFNQDSAFPPGDPAHSPFSRWLSFVLMLSGLCIGGKIILSYFST